MAHQSKDSCMWYDLHGKARTQRSCPAFAWDLPVAFDDHGQIVFPRELHSSSFKGHPWIILQQAVNAVPLKQLEFLWESLFWQTLDNSQSLALVFNDMKAKKRKTYPGKSYAIKNHQAWSTLQAQNTVCTVISWL